MIQKKEDGDEELVFDYYDEINTLSLDDKEAPEKTVEYNEIDFKSDLSEGQLEIINNIHGPMLVIAGAGSGKTRSIVYAVAKLLVSGVKPSEIMLVTFTNKAANEMIKRVENLLGTKPKGIWGGTFHSIANRFLRMYAKTLGLKPKYTILDETDAKDLMKLSFDKADVKDLEQGFPTPAMTKSILSFSINCNKTIHEVIKWKYDNYDSDAVVSKLRDVLKIYSTKKAENSLVDFDDLLFFWNKLLDERFVAKLVAKKIKYILVDEYQDTNYIQDEIIYKIAQQNIEHNIMIVGDDSQSIYGFRGADFQNIMEFSKRFENCRIYKLTQNYRSVPEILNLANDSIKHNKSQFRKEMETERQKGVKPIHIISENDEQQAIIIVNKIVELQRDGYKLNDMAVLYRAGFHSLRIEIELQNRNIPYVVHSGVSFFERAHVKDLLAHLRIIQNSGDEISWSRIFSQFQGIGKKTASKMFDLLSNLDNPLDCIISNNLFINKLHNLRISKTVREEIALYLKDFLKSVKNDKPKDVIIKLINQLIKFLKPQYSNWQDRVEDLKQIGIYSKNYDTIQSFLDVLALNKSTIESKTVGISNNEKHSPVTLSTIHRAKGLEWKIVFIPMLSENLFPSNRVKNNTLAYEEERRVFYVGVTRAKEQLYLLSPQKIKNFKGQKDLNLSQFVNELNPKVYRRLSYQEYLSSLEETIPRSLEKGNAKKIKHLALFTTADSLLKD